MGSINPLNYKCSEVCCPNSLRNEEKQNQNDEQNEINENYENENNQINDKVDFISSDDKNLQKTDENICNFLSGYYSRKKMNIFVSSSNLIKEEIHNVENKKKNTADAIYNNMHNINIENSDYEFKNRSENSNYSREININTNKNISNKNNLNNDYKDNVIKIQKQFRIYLNNKKQNLEKLLQPKIQSNSKRTFDTPPKNLTKNYSSLVCRSPNIINKDEIINVSEEEFSSISLKSNQIKISNIQFCTSSDLDNDKIKGYFLLKKKMFKYYGEKNEFNKKTGYGKIIWEDNSQLKAYFTNSKINGIVYFFNSTNENSTYYGEYIENIPKGYGIYSYKGYKLEGNTWDKNFLTGFGIAVWDENERYEGEFKNSIKNGIGSYIWPDHSIYIGEFKENKISGIGKMNFANGNYYEGEFYDSFLNGWGRFTWDDGKIYEGNYENDKKNGFGMFIWSLKPLVAIIGFWEKGKQNGAFAKIKNKEVKYFCFQRKTKILVKDQQELLFYMQPCQVKYRFFFNKSYKEYSKFFRVYFNNK